jgi:hypothetical protein
MTNKLLRSMFISSLFVSALAVPRSEALACSCMPQAIAVEYRSTPAVFAGRVESIRYSGRNPYGGEIPYDIVDMQIAVEESYKGKLPKTVIVRSFTQESMCGVVLEVGKRYLIWAQRSCLSPKTIHMIGRGSDLARSLPDAAPSEKLFYMSDLSAAEEQAYS